MTTGRSVSLSYKPPFPAGTTGEAEWAVDLEEILGVPMTNNKSSISWLVAQETEEGNPPGSATYATEHNPLDTTLPGWGSSPVTWTGPNGETVEGQAYPSDLAGLEAAAATIEEPAFAPYLAALEDPNVTLGTMEQATAASPWLSTNPADEQGYAQVVAGIAKHESWSLPPSSGVANPFGHTQHNWHVFLTDPAGELGKAASTVAHDAGSAVASAVGISGGSIVKDALYVVAAVAVVALVGGGIAMSAGHAARDQLIPPLAEAA
jgi:hypothetical protein